METEETKLETQASEEVPKPGMNKKLKKKIKRREKRQRLRKRQAEGCEEPAPKRRKRSRPRNRLSNLDYHLGGVPQYRESIVPVDRWGRMRKGVRPQDYRPRAPRNTTAYLIEGQGLLPTPSMADLGYLNPMDPFGESGPNLGFGSMMDAASLGLLRRDRMGQLGAPPSSSLQHIEGIDFGEDVSSFFDAHPELARDASLIPALLVRIREQSEIIRQLRGEAGGEAEGHGVQGEAAAGDEGGAEAGEAGERAAEAGEAGEAAAEAGGAEAGEAGEAAAEAGGAEAGEAGEAEAEAGEAGEAAAEAGGAEAVGAEAGGAEAGDNDDAKHIHANS